MRCSTLALSVLLTFALIISAIGGGCTIADLCLGPWDPDAAAPRADPDSEEEEDPCGYGKDAGSDADAEDGDAGEDAGGDAG
jgi:hypothetical protein